MSSENDKQKELLERATELVQHLKDGNSENANETLASLIKFADPNMFNEIGKITRELHDALVGFEVDTHMTELAESEIPDAKERLSYVLEMTEDAANKTLGAVEEIVPMCEERAGKSQLLSDDWEKFTHKELSADEFRTLAKDVKEYFDTEHSVFEKMKECLNDVLMAQGYQDLTGQIIKRVISLVQDVETNLVRVISLTGNVNASNKPEESSKPGTTKLEGPQVPALKTEESLTNQDDVDDLLSSLGF